MEQFVARRSVAVAMIVLILCGGIIIAVVVYGLLWERKLLKNGIKVWAEVVGVQERNFRGSISYHAVMTYEVDGVEYEYVTPFGVRSPSQYRVGKSTCIYYYANNPKRAVAPHDGDSGKRLAVYIIIAVFGVIMSGLGVLGLFL